MNTFLALIYSILFSCLYFGSGLEAVELPLSYNRPGSSGGFGYYQEQALKKFAEGSIESLDSLNLLVVRVSFQNSDFSEGSDQFPPHDSLYFANELRHLKEYYSGASTGRFNLCCDLLDRVVRLSGTKEYYGGDEEEWSLKVIEMLMETVDSTDFSVDYSEYDAFALIHTGAGRETDIFGDSPFQLWSGFIGPEEMKEILMDTLEVPGIPTNDMEGGSIFYIDNILVLPEESSQDGYVFGSLGIYAYQFGKRLGFLPLYDSTPSGYPDSQGIGNFGLMSYGLYNALGFVPAFPSAFNRYIMGWVEAVEIDSDCRVTLEDINTASAGDTQMVRINLSPSEYFLIVNRVHDTDFDGFFDFGDLNGDGIPQNQDTLLGAEFDFFMTQDTNPYSKVIRNDVQVNKYSTGSGLLIWHVDERVILNGLTNNVNVNNNPALKGVDLEEADGIQDLDRSGGNHSFGSYYDSFREGNNNRFGESTVPSSLGNLGINYGINITDISDIGPKMDFLIEFNPCFESETAIFAGLIHGHSPIPAEVNTSGGIDMVFTADTGLVYLVSDAGSPGWTDRIETIADFPGAVWKGSPVVSDIDGDQVPEIFAVSTDGVIYAFNGLGGLFPIDTDSTPGSLTVPDSIISLPMMIEIDSDTLPEMLVLSSGEDSVFMNITGADIAIEGAREIGNGVFRVGLTDGILVSNPSASSADGLINGFFYIARKNGISGLRLVRFADNGGFSNEYYRELQYLVPEGPLLIPSSGDVDGDGFDDLVISVPETGLIYWSPEEDCIFIYENDNVLSPPALEDIDGDGVLETAARDGKKLFLFTGFGVLAGDWPVSVGNNVYLVEGSRDVYSQPIIEDVDGDGMCEIIFNLGGDLHAYEMDSNPVCGWPVAGTGTGLETPAFFKGVGDELCIFMTGISDITESIKADESDSPMGVSCAVGYSTENSFLTDRGWSFFRHDIFGSGRQLFSESSFTEEETINERTFICYPNPVRGKNITVRISISYAAQVKVNILNIEGECVLEINRAHQYSSGNQVPFEAVVPVGNLASGIYVCYMEINSNQKSWRGAKKFAVIR